VRGNTPLPRVGRDGVRREVANVPEANAFLGKEYRPGFGE
jgi:hypothetical protein